mmetsp:Transcript_9332/g.12932  ORF Transcript_9332/g.12932 Transcript_9332/m.12932 type:complete len:516 (+) Transcript_9332:74-1621(+)|eukprot:CAMPEP_0197302866 /NCGR_PEP_ID=MMETSP0890-20130614/51322_1 /TAXON_ID=44058 ORGANISM="Aureoumbra lagunensis, Strain CCMP1510" /NCGR_SAMPLE_ID=MMETSP0890 /ASSEMBLY_ACC=CAM_ASM_000533 /LENGTH=515 /DNA_ID=CAMNT_0042782587 /DNA_START=3945 /DNA_END=5492 /DNA_ORIENTATION=-
MSSWADADDEIVIPEAPRTAEENTIVEELAKATVTSSEAIETTDGSKITVERAGVEELIAAESWEDLNLSSALLKGVYLADFPKPFKIQQAALPLILSGFRKSPKENLLAQAKSGSGKTAAFVLGLLAHVDTQVKAPQAIVVNPTRELANQNAQVIRTLGKVLIEEQGLEIAMALPQSAQGNGIPQRGRGRGRGGPRVREEPVYAHIIVGTPGKTLGWVKSRVVQTQRVTTLVLDEADEMESLGHRDDTRSLRRLLPDDCQVLCFSATYTAEVVHDIERTVFKRQPHNKVLMNLNLVSDDKDESEDRSKLMVRQIAHVWCAAGDHPEGKLGIVEDIFDLLSAQQSIIFVNTRNDVHRIQAILHAKNFSTQDLTGGSSARGGMDARERDAAMQRFRDGQVKVLIATNVVSRGVDVPGVNIVINYDLPIDFESGQADCDTYIHRVGRTGRAGKRGVAINLVDLANPRELSLLRQIERYCFGSGEKEWTHIQKVDAGDVETIKSVAKSHLAPDTSFSS